MKTISKEAWNRVIEKACDVANATQVEDDPMYEVHRQQMIEILDELEAEYGENSRIYDTRADYVDEPIESRRLRMKALELAKEQNDQDEIKIIQQSLRDLE
jgi:acetoin utilization deacetylase AcuC-like enzyme